MRLVEGIPIGQCLTLHCCSRECVRHGHKTSIILESSPRRMLLILADLIMKHFLHIDRKGPHAAIRPASSIYSFSISKSCLQIIRGISLKFHLTQWITDPPVHPFPKTIVMPKPFGVLYTSSSLQFPQLC